VIVGRDWQTLHHNFKIPKGSPAASSSSTTAVSTTTTTAPGSVDPRFLPVDPKTGGPLVGCPKT